VTIKSSCGGLGNFFMYSVTTVYLVLLSTNSIYFKNEEKNRVLFFKSKGKMNPLSDKN